MFFFKPVEIPGTSIRPPDKPGSKRCPHCGRKFRSTKPERKDKKIVVRCPYCGEKV